MCPPLLGWCQKKRNVKKIQLCKANGAKVLWMYVLCVKLLLQVTLSQPPVKQKGDVRALSRRNDDRKSEMGGRNRTALHSEQKMK